MHHTPTHALHTVLQPTASHTFCINCSQGCNQGTHAYKRLGLAHHPGYYAFLRHGGCICGLSLAVHSTHTQSHALHPCPGHNRRVPCWSTSVHQGRKQTCSMHHRPIMLASVHTICTSCCQCLPARRYTHTAARISKTLPNNSMTQAWLIAATATWQSIATTRMLAISL